MDRNFLSTTDLVNQVIGDLQPFTEMLPRQDRQIFSNFTEYAFNNHAAIANADGMLPLDATLLILLLEEHKRTERLYSELCEEIERLKGVAQQLEGISLMEEGHI